MIFIYFNNFQVVNLNGNTYMDLLHLRLVPNIKDVPVQTRLKEQAEIKLVKMVSSKMNKNGGNGDGAVQVAILMQPTILHAQCVRGVLNENQFLMAFSAS